MVTYERQGAAAVLTIDRPERRNAVDGPTAEALREDLRFLVERAEGLADRLEGAVRQYRPLATTAGGYAASEEPPRSQAERDLLQALRMAR